LLVEYEALRGGKAEPVQLSKSPSGPPMGFPGSVGQRKSPFFAAVTPTDLRLRFFALVKDFSRPFVARLTQIDYARAMAFVAIDEASGALRVTK
jgi:hypothetical protein